MHRASAIKLPQNIGVTYRKEMLSTLCWNILHFNSTIVSSHISTWFLLKWLNRQFISWRSQCHYCFAHTTLPWTLISKTGFLIILLSGHVVSAIPFACYANTFNISLNFIIISWQYLVPNFCHEHVLSQCWTLYISATKFSCGAL